MSNPAAVVVSPEVLEQTRQERKKRKQELRREMRQTVPEKIEPEAAIQMVRQLVADLACKDPAFTHAELYERNKVFAMAYSGTYIKLRDSKIDPEKVCAILKSPMTALRQEAGDSGVRNYIKSSTMMNHQ